MELHKMENNFFKYFGYKQGYSNQMQEIILHQIGLTKSVENFKGSFFEREEISSQCRFIQFYFFWCSFLIYLWATVATLITRIWVLLVCYVMYMKKIFVGMFSPKKFYIYWVMFRDLKNNYNICIMEPLKIKKNLYEVF